MQFGFSAYHLYLFYFYACVFLFLHSLSVIAVHTYAKGMFAILISALMDVIVMCTDMQHCDT